VGWLPEWQRQRQTQIPFGNDKGEEADPCGMTTRRAKAKATATATAKATATATAKAKATAEATANADSLWE
jgi:hypothetical protein